MDQVHGVYGTVDFHCLPDYSSETRRCDGQLLGNSQACLPLGEFLQCQPLAIGKTELPHSLVVLPFDAQLYDEGPGFDVSLRR